MMTWALVPLFCSHLLVAAKASQYADSFNSLDCGISRAHIVLIADGLTNNEEHFSRQIDVIEHVADIFLFNYQSAQQKLRISLAINQMGSDASNKVRELGDFDYTSTETDLVQTLRGIPVEQTGQPFNYSSKLVMEYIEVKSLTWTQHGLGGPLFVVILDLGFKKTKEVMNLNEKKLAEMQVLRNKIAVITLIWEDFFDHPNFPAYGSILLFSETLLENQYLPSLLCKHCGPGWLEYKTTAYTHGILQLSCYSLFPTILMSESKVQTCRTSSAAPVALETRSEFEFIRANLVPFYKSSSFANSSNSFRVTLGLQRASWSIGKRHLWVQGYPLTFHHWRKGYPARGAAAECVVWTFEPKNAENLSGQEDQESYYDDGWEDVGCGELAGTMTLCEANIVFERPKLHPDVITKGQQDYQEIISEALTKGDFIAFQQAVLWAGLLVSEGVPEKSVLFTNRGIQPVMSVVNINDISFDCQDEVTLQGNVPYSVLCDQTLDCSNGRDESMCVSSSYRCDIKLEFECKSGETKCVPLEVVCDLYKDCEDGSDEEDCETCDNILCEDGRCLPKHWFFDTQIDCSSPGRAELKEMTYRQKTSQCVFTCNISQCVTALQMGDGVVDCHGPEGPIDETLGSLTPAACTDENGEVSGEWAPRCIYVKDRFGVMIGCRFFDHLQDCSAFDCPMGYAKCHNSYCIPRHVVRDGVTDCPFGEDEGNVDLNCSGGFVCISDTVQCLSLDLVCDGHRHCPGGDDERYCNISCAPGFVCLTSVVIATDYNKSEALQDLSFIDPRTKYLDFSGIDLSLVFPHRPIPNLENTLDIRFSNCNIQSVGFRFADSSRDFNVVWFDLSFNHIVEVDFNATINTSPIFFQMPQLRSLNLSYNAELHVWNPYALGPTNSLSILDLSHTALKSFPTPFLGYLRQLKVLNLSHTLIAPNLVDRGGLHYPLHLDVLDLQGTNMLPKEPDTFYFVYVSNELYMDSFKYCCPQLLSENIVSHVCSAPVDAFSSCYHLVKDVQALWTLGFLAVLGNGAHLFVKMTRKYVRVAHLGGQFSGHLSGSNFLTGIYALIISAADLYYSEEAVLHEQSWREGPLCKVAGMLATLSALSSASFVFFISLDQLLAMGSSSTKDFFTTKSATVISASIWLICGFIAAIPTLPSFSEWTVYSQNAVCLNLPLTPVRHPGRQYAVCVFITIPFFLYFFTCCIQILCTCYSKYTQILRDMEADRNDVISEQQMDNTEAGATLSQVVTLNALAYFPICVIGFIALHGGGSNETMLLTTVIALPLKPALNGLLINLPLWKAISAHLGEKYLFKK